MTREEAIYRLKNMAWLYGSAEREQNIEAIDKAIEALNNSIQMSNIQQLEAENGFLKEMIKFYREQQTYPIEVVRCKDCRYWNSETNGCKRNPSVEAWYETDFCKYGERGEP